MPSPTPLRHFNVERLDVYIYPDRLAIGQAAAAFVTEHLRQAIAARGEANVIFATGASQYEFLAALLNAQGVDWSRVTAFHLDEYLGLGRDHPASFRRFLDERLFGRLPFKAVHLLDGDAADPQAEADRYAALLHDRVIDVACIGIGENGHLAFNDPPADFETPRLVHVVDLDDVCRGQQVGEGHFATLAEVPRQALSLSVPAILRARALSCVVPDARKASPVQCALKGPITPECPASALRRHPSGRVFLDPASASLLSAEMVGA